MLRLPTADLVDDLIARAGARQYASVPHGEDVELSVPTSHDREAGLAALVQLLDEFRAFHGEESVRLVGFTQPLAIDGDAMFGLPS